MNWDAIIAVAEIAGVIVVIASLIYVGVQIKQNTAIARATIVHETSVFYSRFYELLARDADLTDIYRRGIQGKELSDIEVLRFESLLEVYMAILEDLDHQYKANLYFDEDDDVDLLEFMAPSYKAFLSSPIARTWWMRVAKDSTNPSMYKKMSGIMSRWDAEC